MLPHTSCMPCHVLTSLPIEIIQHITSYARIRDIIILTSINREMIDMAGDIIADHLMVPYRISHAFFKSERMKKIRRANISLISPNNVVRICPSYSLQDIVVSKFVPLSIRGLKVRNSLKILDGPFFMDGYYHPRTKEIVDECLLTVNKIYTSAHTIEVMYEDMTMEMLMLFISTFLFIAFIAGGICMIIYDVDFYPLLFSFAFVVYWAIILLTFQIVVSCFREKRIHSRVIQVLGGDDYILETV